MRFWKRSHTVKIFAHHKAYQELAVSKKSVPFTDVISAYKKDFLLFLRQQLLPFLRGCVRLIFTLCYEVGLFLVRSFETISGLGKKTSRVVAERSTFDGEFFRSTRSVFGVRLKFTMTVFALFMFSCLFLFEGGALVTRGLETKTQVLGLAGAGISNLQEAQDLLKKQNPTQAGQKFALALSTASLRSWIDLSIFAWALNWAVTIDIPSRDDEVTLSIFSRLITSSSTLSVISFSVSSAEAPRRTVLTIPTGIMTSGADSFGIATREYKPVTTKKNITM
jgi:hypothetical protein